MLPAIFMGFSHGSRHQNASKAAGQPNSDSGQDAGGVFESVAGSFWDAGGVRVRYSPRTTAGSAALQWLREAAGGAQRLHSSLLLRPGPRAIGWRALSRPPHWRPAFHCPNRRRPPIGRRLGNVTVVFRGAWIRKHCAGAASRVCLRVGSAPWSPACSRRGR